MLILALTGGECKPTPDGVGVVAPTQNGNVRSWA